MNYPKISIVTPSYNQSRFIERAIASVLEQNYPNIEHIILDNVSTDGTIEILEKYDHLTWLSQPDEGQSDALNQGFQLASGEIIGWLNADDEYLPGCFYTVFDFFSKYPETDVFYGDYHWIDQENQVLQSRRELDFDPFLLKYLHILYIPTTSTFFSKKIFDDGNFLDPSLKYAMDYEFLLRLSVQGYRFSHCHQFLANFRWHDSNKSRIARIQQQAEHEQSLLRHDPFLRRMPPTIQFFIRLTLKLMARGKRYWLKTIQGYYLNQWPLFSRNRN
jgi:glycosyltransferase involved in cell wall biosynthesis